MKAEGRTLNGAPLVVSLLCMRETLSSVYSTQKRRDKETRKGKAYRDYCPIGATVPKRAGGGEAKG